MEHKYDKYIELVDDSSSFGRWYAKIREILTQRNVPSTRLPNRAHFMSRFLACLDENKLEDWLLKYSELEAINVDELECGNRAEEISEGADENL